MHSTTARVLAALREEQDYVSGEGICRALGLSRTAVWKHINKLRAMGYGVESITHRGHRLRSAPNSPIPAEVLPLLRTRQLGRHLVFKGVTESTNRDAAGLAEAAAEEGTVVVADRQTDGRGRMQRSWFSPPGRNLYFSMLLRPRTAPHRVSQIALVAAAALLRALADLHDDLKAGLKWPNDILIESRKVSGVLCEMRAETDVVHHAIVGIGINVNMLPTDWPPELRDVATSLAAHTGGEVSRPRLLAAVLNEFEAGYTTWLSQGLTPFLTLLRDSSVLTGRHVSVGLLKDRIHGTVAGLSDEGALILQTPDGALRQITSGEVHIGSGGSPT